MILETLFSGLGTSVVDKLFNLARRKNDEKLREMLQEELAKMALGTQSNSIIIVNIHIGDLVQQVHELSKQGLSAQAVIAASRAHTLPELLSTSAQQKTAYAPKSLDTLLFYDPLAREGEFYASDVQGGIHFLKRHTWHKVWTHIIPGNFGGSEYTGLLFYSSSTREGKFFSTDGQGNIQLLENYVGWRKSWSKIVPMASS